MDIVILVGRILFALLFVAAGIMGHLMNAKTMTGYAQSKGVPFARLVVLGTGVQLVLGGLSVGLGIWPDLGALLLVLFLLPTTVMMHNFWKETDPQARVNEMQQFQKDLALGGAALALFGLFVLAGDDLGLVIVGPLFTQWLG